MEKGSVDYLDNRVSFHIRSSIPEKEFAFDKAGKISDDELIRIRKDKIVKFFKTNYNWIAYVVLAIIVYLSVKIRTSNLERLKDITTGTWTLGPDLDPFFFLRLAKYIVEEGTLFAVDTMRYVPLGANMIGEYLLHPYMIAWFHKYIGSPILNTESVTHSAVLYPAFMFALTVIAFFFMTRRIFLDTMGKRNANIIGLIAAFFLSVIPSLLPRTIAGIPEKESAAFLFLFLAFYFFVSAWKSDHKYGKYVYALLAGVATTAMANIWGGFVFIFLTIAPTIFFAFLLGKVTKTKFYIYSVWLFSSLFMMALGDLQFVEIASSTSSGGPATAVFFVILVHFIIFNTKLKGYFNTGKLSKIPPKVISLLVTIIVLAVLASIVFGPSFVPSKVGAVKDVLIKPATNRLIQTVAENRQPYFREWAGSFGPHFRGIPVSFWLFFAGSVYLFNRMVSVFKRKERWKLVGAYLILLSSVIFSRYAGDSSLNGENNLSVFVYAMGFIIFVVTVGYYYYKYYKSGEEDILKKINLELILLFSFFFLSIVAARAAVRTIMMLVPPVSIMVSYFTVASVVDALKSKEGTRKIIALGLAGLIIISTLFSGYGFYQSIKGQAPNHVPSVYTNQWQKAMAWVRDNTPTDSVFSHWWDYGYWLQSIGERATVLDGGNGIGYWNHLMGRHALTGTDNMASLEFLYSHDVTHFLIDSTDIGKYGAFSSIGSDPSYDRVAHIPTFSRNDQQVVETKNSTIHFYQGGAGVDDDIIYEENGSKIFLPRGNAGIGAILIERNSEGKMLQPRGVFVYQGQQYTLPLRYGFDGEFRDFGSGVEVGFYLFPRAVQTGGGVSIDPDGAMLYLSQRTVKSQLARLYLYKEDNPYFKLVHSEDDFFVSQIKSQNAGFEYDIIQYQGIRGPIRIWEVSYPDGMEVNEEYLSREYPEEIYFAT